MDDLNTQLSLVENIEKYKLGGRILSQILNDLILNIKEDQIISNLCKQCDTNLLTELNKYKKYDTKGLSFPTCISKNNIAGYYNDDQTKIKDKDVLKIELGIHIDNFPVLLCYTHIIGTIQNNKLHTVYQGAIEASREILKILTPSHNNFDVVRVLSDIEKKHSINLLQAKNIDNKTPGIISYQMSQNIISDYNDDCYDNLHKFIINKHREHYDFQLSETPFEENEVYAIDIAYSTGTGKLTETEFKPLIYKKTDQRTNLKLKASREIYKHFNKENYPIDIRNINLLSNIKNMGIKDCSNKKLIEPYTIFKEKNNEYIVRIMFTVIITDNKPILISGKNSDQELLKISK